MKTFWKKNVLFVCGLFIILTVHAQTTSTPLDDVVNAVKNNRVIDMSRYFDNFVPITINNNQSNYSRNQAELVLHDFFEKNPPQDFKIMDSGSPGNTSKFVIANFHTSNGKYSIYILMRQKENSYVIKEIKLSRE